MSETKTTRAAKLGKAKMQAAVAGATTADGLNPAQREAVVTHDGPLLVIAGAGTGKTRTLVHRLAKMIEDGIPAESVLLLTFTRRAAQEMIARAAELVGERCRNVQGGTFHAFAARVLRNFPEPLGLDRNFAVLDQPDANEIVAMVRKTFDLKGKGFPRSSTIAAIISKAANHKATIAAIVRKEYPQFADEVKTLNQMARAYAKHKKKQGLLDFDDLLLKLEELLAKHAAVRERVTSRYAYVMVDEYQDTNIPQARIAELLAGANRNIMVVGDDAQSIYAFRGACHRNLFDFAKAFPKAKRVTLEENYRSTQPILDLANHTMNEMHESFRKSLFTARKDGPKPLLVAARNEDEQARFTLGEIQKLQQEGFDLTKIAVLFRASRHSLGLELLLETKKVPYVKYGGFRFTESSHLKDVLAYLRLALKPREAHSLIRVLKLCEGIGAAGAEKIQAAVAGKPLGLALAAYPATPRTRPAIQDLAKLMAGLDKLKTNPSACLERIMEYYAPVLKGAYDDWPKREQDLEQLSALVAEHEDLEQMLVELVLDPPSDASRGRMTRERGEGRLVLSTLHSAKGLEWRAVFIIQATDGSIPLVPFNDFDEDEERMDEERRLFYVAVTRAMERLYIVYPGETSRGWDARPSRFVDFAPRGLVERVKASKLMRRGRRKPRGGKRQ